MQDDDHSKTSEPRTRWAEDRTILANERTFVSWNGAGLGAIGVAIGLQAVFGETDPTWMAKAVATLFLLTALVVFWSAWTQARKTLKRLDHHDAEARSPNGFTRLTAMLTVATLATGGILWSL